MSEQDHNIPNRMHESSAMHQKPTEASEHLETRRQARSAKRLNPAHIRRRRAQREQGFEFTLKHTTDEDGYPSVVRARLPQIFDADTLASLPHELRQAIFEVVEATETIELGKTPEERDQTLANFTTRDIVQEFGSIAHVIDAYCIAGFVEPRCYATAEEADANDGVWVRDIEFADRMAFFDFCTERERGASAEVKPFPDDGPVPPVGAGPADPPLSGPDQSEHGAEAQPAAPAPGTV